MTNERKYSEENYPVGTRIQLISMGQDIHPIASGECGTVASIDDRGTLHMKWDNGRTLGVVPVVDSFTVIGKADTEGRQA